MIYCNATLVSCCDSSAKQRFNTPTLILSSPGILHLGELYRQCVAVTTQSGLTRLHHTAAPYHEPLNTLSGGTMRGKSPPAYPAFQSTYYVLVMSIPPPRLFSTAPLKNVSHHEMAMAMGFVGINDGFCGNASCPRLYMV